ncbi:MAG: hypothetical protein ACI828_002766 [Flavobacteriales bacterium]|jgi:hypothetical protein
MKIEHLEERIADYRNSIKTVVDKRIYWREKLIPLLQKTFDTVVSSYDLGWSVQRLKWLQSNEAINITFDSFPPELIDCTNLIPAFQFEAGGALVFSQSYNGDIFVFVLYPDNPQIPVEENIIELGTYPPQEITEKMIVEKVDEFLKEMIKWEVPSLKKKLGY